MSEVIKSFKGFDKDLKCRDFQYEVGKEYEEENASCCHKGFHACEVPMDAFSHYPPATSRYCTVEQSGHLSRDGNGSKVASTKIKIGAEIGIPGLVKAQVEWVKETCKNAPEQIAQGDRGHAAAQGYEGHAAAQGDRGHAAAQGYEGHAAAQGYEGHAAAQGDRGNAAAQGCKGHAAAQGYKGHAAAQGDEGHAAAQGYKGHAAAQGYKGHAAAQGYEGHAAAQGYEGHAAAQGDRGHAAAQGYKGHAEVKGKNAIAAAFGIKGAAKACLGSWIMAAEWKQINGEWQIACVLTAKVDGESIKPDTWYIVKDGKFVECE